MSILDLLRPKWKSSNPQVRIEAIKSITKQKTLLKCLAKEKNEQVLLTVVEKLESETVLHNLAKYSQYWSVQGKAYEKLGNKQKAWQLFALNIEDPVEARRFLNQISDPDILYEVYQKSKDLDIRKIVIQNLFVDSILSEIFSNNDETREIRIMAFFKLKSFKTPSPTLDRFLDKATDDDILRYLKEKTVNLEVLKDIYYKVGPNSQEIREYIINSKNDQFFLNEIGKITKKESHYSGNTRLMIKIVEKLNNDSFIADLIQGSKDKLLLKCGIKKLTDQNILKKLANEVDNKDVFFDIIDKIENQGFLMHLASKKIQWSSKIFQRINDQDLLYRSLEHYESLGPQIIDKLTDHGVLKEIVLHDKSLIKRNSALKVITDQDFLTHIAQNEELTLLRKTAVGKIMAPKVLESVIRNDEDESVRCSALMNLTNSKLIEEVAKNDISDLVRERAVDKVSNKKVLKEIAKNDHSQSIRIKAQKMLGMTDSNDIIDELIEKLSRNDSRSAAYDLVEIAKKNPEKLLDRWNTIKSLVETPHNDGHRDTGRECTVHDDYTYNTGIGLKFPPHPNNL